MTIEENLRARELADMYIELISADLDSESQAVRDRCAELLRDWINPQQPPAPTFDAEVWSRTQIPFGRHMGEAVYMVPLDYLEYVSRPNGDIPRFIRRLRRYLSSKRVQGGSHERIRTKWLVGGVD